jgi:hypothetical protein
MPTFVHGKTSALAVSLAGTQNTIIDISNSLKEINFPRQIDMAETSAFGNSYKTYIQGLADATISVSGQWATGSATDIDDLLSGLIGAANYTNFAYAPAGFNGTTGTSPTFTNITASTSKPLFHGHVWLSSYEITGSIGDVVSVSAEFQMATDVTRITASSYTPA